MKFAKVFAILFALILAVFCFSAPLVNAGDEHPWDEEGPSYGGTTSIDPNGDNGGGTTPSSANTYQQISASTIYTDAVLYLQNIVLYHELPSLGDDETQSEAENPSNVGADE